MARPLGSKNKPKPQPSSAVSVADGYMEAFSGLGTNRDRSSFITHKAAYILGQGELSDMYIGDGFARKIVDSVAEEMTRAGVDLEGMENDELEDSIESKLDELNAMQHFNDALRWSRLFGGSIMVFGLNDGGTLEVPLNPEGIRSVEFLRVYDRYQATIQTRNTDPASIDYGKPEMWQISPVAGGSPYLVHNSRIWMFDGDAVPELVRQANQGWGASALQSCVDQLQRFGTGHQYASMLLERSQQAVHKIPGLANTLRSPGGEEMIRRRVDAADYVRSVMNMIVIDGEEEYTVTTLPLTGVPDVLDRQAEALSAVARIPVSVLLERQVGGLSNSDKGSLDKWHARIESDQNDILRKPIDLLITYIIRSLTQEDVEYKLCFKPLVVKSEKEEAEIDKLKADARKVQAEADGLYITNQVIDPNEVRAERGEEYNIEPGSELVIEEVTPADVAATQQGATNAQ